MKNGIKILIAEEDTAGRSALAGELKRSGFETVIEAENGEDALIQIERHRPDVAIIDVWLSKLDGIGVVNPHVFYPHTRHRSHAHPENTPRPPTRNCG